MCQSPDAFLVIPGKMQGLGAVFLAPFLQPYAALVGTSNVRTLCQAKDLSFLFLRVEDCVLAGTCGLLTDCTFKDTKTESMPHSFT